MVWNTIAHPRMMNGWSDNSGSTIALSEEALESPIKHMNRDLLATFDYIVWVRQTSDSVPEANRFSKTTLLTGDFDSLFAAGKNKTIVNGLLIASELGIRQNPDTKAAEYYPVEKDGMNCYIQQLPLIIPKSLYGKMAIESIKFDFEKDSFVMILINTGGILISSSGEVFDDTEAQTELMKYAVNEESGEA